jgi:hypothetical protein
MTCNLALCLLSAAQDKAWREGDATMNWVWLRYAAAAGSRPSTQHKVDRIVSQ